MKRPFLTILATAALVTVTGCDENARVARVAQEAADRQADQNKELARLSRETAEGTKRLVGADAETRKELASLQRDLQAAASEVGRQRIIRGVEPQALRDNEGLRQHVATEMSRVQSVLDGLLVDRPRRNILRRPK